MSKIKNIVFDLGGVLIHLDRDRSVKRFEEIGVKDAEELIDAYEQKGIFLDLENGKLDSDGFCKALSDHVGRELSYDEIQYAWLGFVVEVPQYKLDFLLELRKDYNVYLLSNTNPMLQKWARSAEFTPKGLPINDYFDKMYASYEVGLTKPNPAIFDYMVKDSGMIPSETLFVDDGLSNVEIARELGFNTYLPENKEDWREAIKALL